MSNAIDNINAHADLGAEKRGNKIMITVYGRPAGYITDDDVQDAMDRTTPTGWPTSKALKKGALKVYEAIRSDV